jgi:hypothetical protein
MAEKKIPSTLIAAAVLMFVSALFNFSWAISFGVAFFWLIIPICLGFWAITWMVIEITWGVLLLGGKMDKPPLWIPIVEIILGALFLNPFTFGCGIANVILMTRKDSKKFYKRK